MNQNQVYPKWLRDIIQLVNIRAQFVLSGNIRDSVLLTGEKASQLVSLQAALWQALEPLGYQGFLIWDMVDGLRAYPPDPARLPRLNAVSDLDLAHPQPMRLGALATVLRRVAVSSGLTSTDGGVVLIIDYASRIHGEGRMADDVREFFVAAEKAALEARPQPRPSVGGRPRGLFNPILWLTQRPNDLPYWLTLDNERVRSIPLPLPDADTRYKAGSALWARLPNKDVNVESFAKVLASLTNNMSINALQDIVALASQQGIAASDIADAVQSYRIGDTTMKSPWRGDQLRQRIIQAESSLGERVKGQPQAVTKVLDILKRTSIGLSGAQANASASRPRGVLFFAGPTGVGKTEMAKAIADIVFGDESAYLRFDMSEFSAEHSGDRLIGAPPGYVGFDQGGELTNAMRERPFRVVLFDEIEKAHNRILDKFLQVLEDGRLTDGRGETVYFSEALIIFTSNAGISLRLPNGEVQIRVRPEDDYRNPEEFEQTLRKGIHDYFHLDLRRPELLNRLGENIVIFHFITEEVARKILEGMVENVRQRLREEHEIEMVLTQDFYEQLRKECAVKDLSNGGRGIGSKLEAVFINPLARLLFRLELPKNSSLTLTELRESKGTHELCYT